jgi:hypothetical protein
MGKLYRGQTDITVEVTVDFNLTGFTSALLIFRSPKGDEKIATNTVIIDAVTGILQFIPINNLFFDTSGAWRCWARCVNGQGLVSIGEASQFIIYEEGN